MGHAIGTLGPLPFAQGRAWIGAGMLEHRRRHLSDPLQVGLPMLSVLDLLRRIDGGTLTPEGAVRLAREAIFSQDERIGAFVSVDAAAPVGREGPLRGIAVGVKDIIDTADLPTECGSPVYAGWRPKADAPIVAAARRAGATVIGKTATTPFAYLDPTVTRNPSNREHTPGGSSSGSAAAVAAGMVALAIGTQTGGSVIRPASFCGIAAIKPSYRVLPTVGVKTFSWSLDTPGLFASSVRDVAYALSALTGRENVRVDGRSPDPPRIAVVTQDFADAPEPASVAALDHAARAVERAGASVRGIPLPPALAEAFHVHGTIQDFEARQALAWEIDHHRDALPPLLRASLEAAAAIPVERYDDARRTARRARGALADVFTACDVLLTLSAPGPAPRGLASTGDARFNRLWTLMGNPCVNVPALADSAGLPVGVQVIAAFGRDDNALAAAAFVEQALSAHG
jgi:Asp-tRNA(Asn)/Glu-tRNA(Gln) amidotransferase A subunit family amidase